MKPLRRKKTCEVTHDPITGQERILELSQEDDFLSDHGSVDSAGLHQRYFRDCGCDGPIGGRCFECGAISCKSCHGRCHNCQKPICLDEKDREICFEMLSKDTPVPSIRTKLFKLSGPGQTEVLIKLLQGNDGQDVKDCTALGHFELKDLPPRSDLIGRIEITFTLDANGILSAKARDVVSGKQSEMEIDYKSGITANQMA